MESSLIVSLSTLTIRPPTPPDPCNSSSIVKHTATQNEQEKDVIDVKDSNAHLPLEQEQALNPSDEVVYDPRCKSFFFACPHCAGFVSVDRKSLNCCIFRHGRLSSTGKQIPPHAKKSVCDSKLVIDGCGQPFQLVKKNKKKPLELTVRKCGFI